MGAGAGRSSHFSTGVLGRPTLFRLTLLSDPGPRDPTGPVGRRPVRPRPHLTLASPARAPPGPRHRGPASPTPPRRRDMKGKRRSRCCRTKGALLPCVGRLPAGAPTGPRPGRSRPLRAIHKPNEPPRRRDRLER